MQPHTTPWPMPSPWFGHLPLDLFSLVLFVQNNCPAILFHRLLKCLCGNNSNVLSVTPNSGFMRLDIKQRRSCREQQLGTRERRGFHKPDWPGHVWELRVRAGGCQRAEGANLDNHSPPALTKGSSAMGIKVLSAWTATSQRANSRESIQNISVE